MKPKDIEPGKTYINKGKGKNMRTVIAIGNDHRPSHWLSNSEPPEEPGVLYKDMKGIHSNLYLSSFAAWAGAEKNKLNKQLNIMNYSE